MQHEHHRPEDRGAFKGVFMPPVSGSSVSGIKTIEELPIAGKRVFMRLDFNVPLKEEGGMKVVADDTRIREALPTIKYAIDKGAKLILASHLGRPDGIDPEFSLAPVAEHLSGLLGLEVLLTDDCVGDGIQMIVKHLKAAQVILLENLRFHPEEEKNDPKFAHELASLAEVYITDAFGTAHRKHASTYGVPQLISTRGCGYLIQKELRFLGRLIENPEHPFVTILGGSKVADKIKTIESLFKEVDTMLIGGAMGNTFRVATDSSYKLPASAKQPKAEEIAHAKSIVEKAAKAEVRLLLPVDDNQGFDIGPKTIEMFTNEIRRAKTIFWNGPVGMFEKAEYATGTLAVANAMAESSALKVVGGGDTVSAVNQAGVASKIDHISTGGGASLEFLEGEGLPGIDILRNYSKRTEAQPIT
jgi:phosphoglycerate kinase